MRIVRTILIMIDVAIGAYNVNPSRLIKTSPGSRPINGSFENKENNTPAQIKTIPTVMRILPISFILDSLYTWPH